MHRLLAITCLLLGTSAGALGQSTWYVDVDGAPPGSGTLANPYTSLQYAVDQPTTLDGDELVVSPGVYEENLDLTGRDLGFTSTDGSGATFIGPSKGGSIIHVENGGLRMDGFTIFDDFPGNPASGDGGGIHARFSDVELRNCSVIQCKGLAGGGLYWIGGSESLLLEDCDVGTNRATDGAGIFATGLGAFTVTLRRCELSNNYAVNTGGGAMIVGGNPMASFEVVDTEFVGNAALSGGGLRGEAIHGELENTFFDSNSAVENGGGASFEGGDEVGPIVVRTCRFERNDAEFGAGLHTIDVDRIEVLDGTRFWFNQALHGPGLEGEGGGADLSAHNGGLVQLVLFHSNEAEKGAGLAIRGGINPQAAIEVNQCLFTEGSCYGPSLPAGAGVLVDGGYSRISNSSITLNHAGSDGFQSAVGGGMFLTGACHLEVDNVTFSENQAGVAAQGGSGGAIYGADVGDLVVRNSLFQVNTAYTRGGAVWTPGLFEDCTFASNRSEEGGAVRAAGTTTLIDCDLVLNVANSFVPGAGGRGGAVYGSATLINCELGSNKAYLEGGGTWGANLQSCILRNNSVIPADPTVPAMGGGAYGGVLTDCSIFENEAEGGSASFGHGGGAAFAELIGCEIRDNRAGIGGGIADSSLDRCTLADNTAFPGPSAAFFSAPGMIENSILWGPDLPVLEDNSGQLVVNYSDVQSGWSGTGNLDSDPRFWLEIGKDYNLAPTSPCIDAGDPLVQDPDGSRVDMGAHPFDAQHVAETVTYCTAKVTSKGETPAIQATGVLSLSGSDDFFVNAVNVVQHQFGLFFWGPEPAETPLFGGTLCVGGSLVRTAVQNSGGDKTYSFHFSHAYLASVGLSVSDKVYGQYWFRDPGFLPPNAIGWTNAVAFAIHP